MKRLTTALLAALEALIVVAIGLGISAVPLTVLWATQFGLTVDGLVFWRAAVDVWLLGNGVDLAVQLDPALVAALGLPGADAPFPITIALLGFALLAASFGLRTGRRAAETPFRWVGATAAVLTYALFTILLAATAGTDALRPALLQGILLPTAIYAAGVLLGADPGLPGRVLGRFVDALPGLLPTRVPAAQRATLPDTVRTVAGAALRGGTAAAAGVVGVASVVVCVLILGNFATIIGLYETVQAGILGGIVLTLAQLALIPNLVIWAASWLVGPGIAVGAGSSVSPIGTSLGAVPGLPIFGALPHGSLAFGFLGLLAPVVFGFLAAVIIRQRTPHRGAAAPHLAQRLLTGLGTGLVAGVLLGLLAWWSGGALGPGRLVEVGPNPLLVAVFAALEVGIAACAGLLTPEPRALVRSRSTGAATGASTSRVNEATSAGRLLGRLRDLRPPR
ncbi:MULTISPECIES: DUF6350 family protein [Cryobacterium]|uniref:cell division protein PerM n=1 Tax=Cryobacterium TaxID=69578 RepID=UPI001F5409B1|nr:MULTISPECIES: DUF6350 family protein [Cryobacterium]